MENTLTFDLDDTSPTIQYIPFSDTLSTPNLSAGWNPYYDQSGFAPAQGSIGNGTSLHITSFNGASLSVQWRGTGIKLLGNATSASYQITIDGQSATPQPDINQNILTSIDGLDDASHTVTLIAQIPPESATDTTSMLVFDKAILASSPISSNVSFKPEAIDDSEIQFLGSWLRETSPVNNSFHVSRTIGDRVITTFRGTSLFIQGKTSPGAADYQVTLDNSTVTTSLSGRSSFTIFNTTLYFATGLDPSLMHSVEVRNADGGELALLVGGINAFTPVNPPPGPTDLPDNNGRAATMTFSKGTLAAFVLGGMLAFILISAALYYFLIYRPRRHRNFGYGPKDIYHYNAKERDPVIDIAQNGSKGFGVHVKDVDGGSGRSGFSRWRRETADRSFRGVDLPLSVRNSGNLDEKQGDDEDDMLATYEWSAEAVSIPPSDTSSARKVKAKRKGKARQITGRSWSPSIKLEFPVRHSQLTNGLTAGSARPPSDGYISSFMAAQPSPNEFPASPPSYAASTSLHTSNSFVSSLPSSLVHAIGPPAQTNQHQQYALFDPVHSDPDHGHPLSSQPFQTEYHLDTAHQRPSLPPNVHHRHESLLDPPSLHEVLRSLSPRTSVRPASGYHADVSRRSFMQGLGIDASDTFRRSMLPDVQSISESSHSQPSKQPTNARDSQASNALTQATKSEESDPQEVDVHPENGLFLSVTETSPFRVDFDLRSLSSHGSRRQKSKVEVKGKDAKKHSRISSALSHVRFETLSGRSKSSGSSRRMSMPTRTPEFVQGTSKAPFRLTPLTLAPSKAEHNNNSTSKSPSDGVTSFLDFTSSYEASILSRSRSAKTVASASEEFGRWEEPAPPLPIKDPKSRWSNTTIPSDATGSSGAKKPSGNPKSRWSNTTVPSLGTNAHGLQESSSSGSQKSPYSGEVEIGAETEGALSTDSSTFPIPFKIAIPPSPHHVMQPDSSPERRSGSSKSNNHRSRRSQPDSTRALTLASGTTGSSHLTGLHQHPTMSGLDSPTESMGPMSISELHFNHGISEGMASKRTTASSSMPQFTNGEAEDLPPLPEEYRPRPFDPSILVNRVLGLPSPGVSSTMSTVRGKSSNADMSSALASSSFATRTPSPRYDL
ncbi:hypothetical protein BJ165DRAFT_1448349 [Panaeolus papilionaceus]|nr:hypothetical protein BJ165DRAFT_1448349 [Panaeolus papilionaceus]